METSRGEMGKTRELVTNKYSEIIDLISSEQVDREKLNKALDEMVLLRGAMERRAVMRLKKVFQSIPEENRKAFAEFLKERVCLGRGFHHGRGRHGRRGCPMGGGGH
jgi:Spy/CpxP family protein refolding chaperone